MNLKKISLFVLFPVVCLMLAFVSKKEYDPLHKRKFNINISEVKEGSAPRKPVADVLEFKDGKLFSDYLYDKMQYKWIKYRINKDSTFMDETDTEVRYLEVEASTTDEKDQTLIMNFKVQEWDIEGTIKITKNDKPKKFFDFVGREKGGKPKKEKKEAKKEGEGSNSGGTVK
ncbi:MAG: hypothetical protein QM534_04370 [Sediminibacterium sp.]|nr:hypothetical protein [Sediminibacterium sp.]